jgi:hypothetical protein
LGNPLGNNTRRKFCGKTQAEHCIFCIALRSVNEWSG